VVGAVFRAIRARWKRFWRTREDRAGDEWNDGTA